MPSLRKLIRAARSELKAGHWDRARSLFAQVLTAAPGHREATHGYGIATLQSGAMDDAIAWFQRAIEADAGCVELRHGLGRALLRAERPGEALPVLEAAHARKPDDARVCADLDRARQRAGQHATTDTVLPSERGAQLLAHGRIEDAIAELRAVAEQRPDDARTHEWLGHAWLQDGRLEQAERAFREAIRLGGQAPAYLFLADTLSAAGDQPGAEAAVRDSLRLLPGFGLAWLRLAHLKRFTSAEDSDLRRLVAISSAPGVPAIEAEPMHFALGKIYDDLRRPDDAFRHLRLANELHKDRAPFDMKALLEFIDRIEATCDEAFFSRCKGWGLSSSVPVFIVGVPRCGSTLVEQIIASHPQAYGVGELKTLARLTADLPARLGTPKPFPACLRELDRDTTAAMAADYLERLTRDAPDDVLRVCDKMLSNLLLIGLLSALFPKGTVLHCERELMDTGLSMYMQSFGGSGVGYAYDLDHIGEYHERCERLMNHWKRVSPMTIVEVRYEELVREPARGVRALIDAVGLPWDDRCLASHRAERQVRTVSDWQVRQPIHAKSVERWRVYEEQLAPLARYRRA